MAVKVVLGGTIRPFEEGEVDFIGKESVLLWKAQLISPYASPYVLLLSQNEFPCGFYTVKGELTVFRNRPAVLVEKIYWGARISLCYGLITVRKALKKGKEYLCRFEMPLKVIQESGTPLKEGETAFIEGEFRIERTKDGWSALIDRAKPII